MTNKPRDLVQVCWYESTYLIEHVSSGGEI